jgi:fido (protein-threonine AMPylation protein)
MAFDPGYGETLLTEEESDALTVDARELLGDPILRADLYDLEQQVQVHVADVFVGRVLDGTLLVSDLLADHFVREMHGLLYAPIWTWGGRQRIHETNIGIAPEQISVELRACLVSLLYRWEQGDDLTARALGIHAHAETVRIHPFIDGNGRATRLLADLVFLAAQQGSDLVAYDWDFNRDTYLRLLRQYDQTRDVTPLVSFVPIARVE